MRLFLVFLREMQYTLIFYGECFAILSWWYSEENCQSKKKKKEKKNGKAKGHEER